MLMAEAKNFGGTLMKRQFGKAASRLFCFSILAIVFGIQVFAQTVSGTLRGTVTDPNGAVVPNATVKVVSTETGLERTVVSSSDGVYNFAFLPIGTYTLEATGANFAKFVEQNVLIRLNETAVLNIPLKITVAGDVTVTDTAEPINSTNQQITQSLTNAQLMERPVGNQTNFLTLAETFTGYQENPTSGQNNPTLSSGSSVNFNGTGTRGATFQINGVNNDDASENQNRQGAAFATIKEFQVISNNFTAEFGRGYGAVVLVQTKSGTNNLNGSAYWFHQDSALNAARSYFSHTPKPVDRRNQFGFAVGFPIMKNKLFGFLNLDHVENSGALTYRRDVFLMSERDPANWFTNAQSAAFNTPANRAFIQSVIDRFANAVPNSTLGPRVFEGQQPFDRPDRDYSGRIDWNATENDVVFARWQYTRQRRRSEDIILGEATEQNNKQQNFGATWTHIFNTNIVGEFRYGLGLRTTLVNILQGNDTPVIRFTNNLTAFGASIIGNAGSFPIQRYQTDNQLVYNMSWVVKGDHFLKFGVDTRDQDLDDLADNFSRGFYSFGTACRITPASVNPTVTINYLSGFQALINGCLSNFQKGYGPFYLQNRMGEINLYFEDTWKVRPNLTLNLGVRYEYVKAPREAEDLLDYGFDDDVNNLEPRIGFAYSPNVTNGFLKKIFGENGDSSIRGGYGIYHGRVFQSVFSQGGATVRFNPPNARFLNETIPSSFFSPNNLQDPTLGFVFVPGPQTGRISITIPDPDLEMPYTNQWNLTFERQMPWSSALRVSYTGNHGVGLIKYSLGNLPIHDPNGVLVVNHPNNGSLAGQIIRPAADIFCAGTTATTINDQCPNVVTLAANEYSVRNPRSNERRPDPLYGQNLVVSNSAWSYYNGLQVEWNKRLSHDLNFQVAYTWAKAIDTTSEATAVGAGDGNINGPDELTSRGLSRFHTPHRFTFFGTYRLPFFKDRRDIVGQILGGWEVSTVVKLVHGTPFTVSGAAFDLNLDGFSETRPVLLDPSVLGRSFSDPSTSQQILAGALAIPTSVSQNDCCILGRNTFYLDGTETVDFNFTKRFLMPWEGHDLAFRVDMFNAFNHVQVGFPNTTYTANVTALGTVRARINPALGQITGFATSYSPRVVQLSLKYNF